MTTTTKTNGKATDRINELIEAAEDYRRRGLKPLPLDGKNPGPLYRVKEWQKRDYDANAIRICLSEATDPGIGVQMGPASGIVDFEYDNAAQLQKLIELFGGPPPTGPQFTSKQGGHWPFKWDDRLRACNCANLYIECDDGSCLIVRIGTGPRPGSQSAFPPSRNKAWKPGLSLDDCDPPQLPDHVIEALIQYAKPNRVQSHQTNGHAASLNTNNKNVDRCLGAMLKVDVPRIEGDSSGRLVKVARQAKRYGFVGADGVQLVRLYAVQHPFEKDWTDAEIERRIDEASAEVGEAVFADGKPRIDTSVKDLAITTPLAWEALQHANDPPRLFCYGGAASRIERQENESPNIRLLKKEHMRYELAESANWIEYKKAGDDMREQRTAPPYAIVDNVLATPNHPLPVLARIVEAPVFAADGTLQTTPGYHPKSCTYYAPAAGFTVPNVLDHPEGVDIENARILICDELLFDFPFVSDPDDPESPNAELAHAVAFLLLPFARDLIDGPTPLHLFEKPSPGTGATLLIDMLSLPSLGRSIPTMTEGRDEDEWRKRITAKLRGGSPFVLIDNLRRRLDSAAVSAGITSTTWEDRILGFSEMIRLPVRCAWAATGNNPAVSTEIARRTVRIRMDAKLDRPWLRGGFKHENLRRWATEKRGLLVWSALTMIQAWIAKGRPLGKLHLGMFERWSEVMGGILDVAGIPGFLTNLTKFYEESDAEGATWRDFLAAWWEQFGENETTVRDLWKIAADDACLPLGDKGDQSQRIILGKMLADRRDRVFDFVIGETTLRLLLQRGDKRQRAYQWQLRQIAK